MPKENRNPPQRMSGDNGIAAILAKLEELTALVATLVATAQSAEPADAKKPAAKGK
jgi:hypothetical protein